MVQGDQPTDRRKQAYGHAFVVLAGAMAVRAGVPGARELLDDAVDIAATRMFRGDTLAINTASEDFSEVTPYRGQNPNMHFCEAFIAAYEATGDKAISIAPTASPSGWPTNSRRPAAAMSGRTTTPTGAPTGKSASATGPASSRPWA